MNIKLIISGILFVILPFVADAQRGPLNKEMRDRIESQRIAFITQKLSLTPDEATKFWPLYNEHKEQLKNLKDEMERPDLMNVTDNEANAIIDRHLQAEQKRLDLKRSLIVKLKTAIPPRKILLLHAAERDFNRELLQKANDYRRD